MNLKLNLSKHMWLRFTLFLLLFENNIYLSSAEFLFGFVPTTFIQININVHYLIYFLLFPYKFPLCLQ